MKRTPLKRKSKSETAKLKAKLWELCKIIIRKRDGRTCTTCRKGDLDGSSWQTGHFIPSAACGAFLRYDLRNLGIQCYYCNINLGGHGTEFTRVLVEKHGQDFVDRIWKDKQNIIKADKHFYNQKIEEYTVYSELSKEELLELTRSL